MISAEKLRVHFEDHFKEDQRFEMPEELENPKSRSFSSRTRP